MGFHDRFLGLLACGLSMRACHLVDHFHFGLLPNCLLFHEFSLQRLHPLIYALLGLVFDSWNIVDDACVARLLVQIAVL